MHISRVHSAGQLVATLRALPAFLKHHPGVNVIVVDSIAFCFRHEFEGNPNKRSRVLADIAARLRQYGAENNLISVVTNHMTVRFDRSEGSDRRAAWLAPALGESWEHQASTQVRLERLNSCEGVRSIGRATLTKAVEQIAHCSCLYRIEDVGVRDVDDDVQMGVVEVLSSEHQQGTAGYH